MGSGRWDSTTYSSNVASRKSAGVSDFAYTETAKKVHESLDPRRINKKPAGTLESRDSAEHPESLPVIFTFDVTGSNFRNAVVAQRKLPELMESLAKVVPNPQVAVWSNDDYKEIGINSIQVSEFESDIRIDESIRNVWLTSKGGGNDGESYDLLLYCAARKTVLDSLEKRGKKGYMLLYADEPIFSKVDKQEVEDVFGDHLEKDIPIKDIIEEVKAKFNLYILWPTTGYTQAREQYVQLVGDDHVLTVQGPEHLVATVSDTVRKNEQDNKEAVANSADPANQFYRDVT